MKNIFKRTERVTLPAPEPSTDARLAKAFADHLTERADKVFSERAYLNDRNHYAERIRLSYEGR